MEPSQKPMNIFLSYATQDKWLLGQLETHLSLLKREGLISTWCNREVLAGSNWAGVIDQRMELAKLILLIVSADFLASDYCYHTEMQRALERQRTGEAIVIPVIGRPVAWKSAPFASLSPLPTGGKAITTWSNRDTAFTNVVTGIRERVQELASRPSNSPNTITATPRKVTPPSILSTDRQKDIYQIHSNAEQCSSEMVSSHMPDIARGVPQTQVRFGAPFPKTWNVPRRHNAFFTGRESVLDHISERIRIENSADMISPQAITGLGGMGKTQVVAEYAYRFRGDYQAVLWVNAETPESLLADFTTIARLLKRPEEHLRNQASLMQSMQEWFMAQTDWLLIFDNADTPSHVDPFLPRAARGHILATTRAGAVVEWAQPLKLEALAVDDGALCILRRAGLLNERQQLTEAPLIRMKTARQLSEMMGKLPLALEQAGAYINDTECGMNRYLDLYTKYRTALQASPHGTLRDYRETVASAWKISQSVVEMNSPAAAELLRLCAFLSPEGIPDDLVSKGASALGEVLGPVAEHPIKFDQAVGVLHKYSLLNRDVDGETELTKLSIHRIMQEVLLDEMEKLTQKLWAERTVRAVELASRSMEWSRLQAHARKCQILIKQWHMTFVEARRLLQWIEKNERFEQR